MGITNKAKPILERLKQAEQDLIQWQINNSNGAMIHRVPSLISVLQARHKILAQGGSQPTDAAERILQKVFDFLYNPAKAQVGFEHLQDAYQQGAKFAYEKLAGLWDAARQQEVAALAAAKKRFLSTMDQAKTLAAHRHFGVPSGPAPKQPEAYDEIMEFLQHRGVVGEKS